MIVLLKIAWRNINRNRYRSMITIASIGIGFTSLILLRAFVDGSHYQMIDNYTGLVSGHVQIHKDGFHDNMGLSRSIKDPAKIEAAIAKNSMVLSAAPRVKDYCLISSAEQSSGVLLMGIDPEREKEITELHKRIGKGRFIENSEDVVIGKSLAKLLNVDLQDKIVLLGQAYDGSLASGAYRICGLLDTGADEIDKGFVLITLTAAQELFVLDKKVSEFALRVNTHEEVKEAAATLKDSLSSGE
ncbi:MAG: ABC transporter permease, partial [Candidatus Omnitrophota bacterium]